MRYSTPELLELGPASVLVLGDIDGRFDNVATYMTQPPTGVALGLDD